MVDSKKVANNILDFLIDPTRIPVKERVYFRPEEILRNEIYEGAKADACATFKDQKHNSDFYPQKNRPSNREAYTMDRKSLIASFDILSKNFKDASDPFAVDLQNMAVAVSRMDDESIQERLASDAPDIEVLAAETFPCPKCGTKVLEKTKYCVKCKAKVEPKKASEEVEAAFGAPVAPGMGGHGMGLGRFQRLSDFLSAYEKDPEATEKIKSVYDEFSQDPEIKTYITEKIQQPKSWLKKFIDAIEGIASGAAKNKIEKKVKDVLVEKLTGKAASEDTSDFWTKEASDLIAKNLVAEIIGVTAEEDEKEEAEEVKPVAEEKKPVVEEKVEEKPAVEACDTAKAEEKKVEEKKATECAVEKKDEEVVEKKEAVAEVQPTEVNTDVLASYNFAGIEVNMNAMDEIGELSAEEKANLAQLF